MNNIHQISNKLAEKRLKELEKFLIELDSICDKLYNRLDYDGVWESLMELEDVRVKYYTEYYEYKQIVLKGKS